MRWLIVPLLILTRAGLLAGARAAARNWRRTSAVMFGIGLGMLLLEGAAAPAAEQRSFPYEGVVATKELYVRSGPGPRYYPTSLLKKGERVLVQRHDPGGWYMIAPPPGSFSWIPAKHVQKLDAGRGTVSSNGVVVRVGSFESDIRDLFQRKLSQGDEVKILGEKMLAGENSSTELWYRIEPPRSEWRWIKGEFVTTIVPGADPSAVKPDPFDSRVGETPAAPGSSTTKRITLSMETPAETTTQRPVAEEYDPRPAAPAIGNTLSERPLIRKSGAKKKAKPGSIEFEREEVERLDARLQAILDQPPLEWNFEQVTSDFRALRDSVSHEVFRTQIDSSLTLIEQKQRVQAEHQAIERLGEETLRRDAELAALQREHESRLLGITRKPSPFDGAGIIQRAAGNVPNAPAYVLLAPNGRVLAYLQTGSGVNLEAWVGKSAGIFGSRTFRDDLKADLLVVNTITAVRLAPQAP